MRRQPVQLLRGNPQSFGGVLAYFGHHVIVQIRDHALQIFFQMLTERLIGPGFHRMEQAYTIARSAFSIAVRFREVNSPSRQAFLMSNPWPSPHRNVPSKLLSMGDFRIAISLIAGWFWIGGLFFPAVTVWAQAPDTIPDAPQPAIIATLPVSAPALPPNAGQSALPRHRWRPWIDPDQPPHPLTPSEKMKFWLHLEIVPWSPAPSFISAGFEQGIDGNPKYGTDSGAFGERLGAAFVRDGSMRFFVSSFFPVVLHEDPRYYRVKYGRIVVRGLKAGQQALLTHTDSGRVTPNYSDLLGHLAACALTVLYYPAPSANGRVVAEAWVTSIAGDAGNNLLLEFVPSLMSRWRQHRLRTHLRSSQTRRAPSIHE